VFDDGAIRSADPPIRSSCHAEERQHRRLIAALNRKTDILTATSAKSF
jgi:hypothetical protein